MNKEKPFQFLRSCLVEAIIVISYAKQIDRLFAILASLVIFASILTCILGGLMGQYFGRKRSLILTAPIFILGFICQAVAPGKEVLLFGRFLAGVGGGLASGPSTVCFCNYLPMRFHQT